MLTATRGSAKPTVCTPILMMRRVQQLFGVRGPTTDRASDGGVGAGAGAGAGAGGGGGAQQAAATALPAGSCPGLWRVKASPRKLHALLLSIAVAGRTRGDVAGDDEGGFEAVEVALGLLVLLAPGGRSVGGVADVPGGVGGSGGVAVWWCGGARAAGEGAYGGCVNGD